MSRLVIFLAAKLRQQSLITAALTHNLKRHCVLQSISAKNTRQREEKGVTSISKHPHPHPHTHAHALTFIVFGLALQQCHG